MTGNTTDYYVLLSAIIADAAFWVGLTTVAVFAAGRFNERRVDTDKDLDPPLTADCFTSRFRFNSALVMYVLFYCGFYGTLIFGFSFEMFQGFFKELFGPIAPTGDGVEFGTPAWVATLVPILVSTTPWFRERDYYFRRWLWGFAGVPQTAQAFANELVAVSAQKLPPLRPDHVEPLTVDQSMAVNEVLTLINKRMRDRFDDYKDFLYHHEALNRSLQDTFLTLQHSANSDADHATRIAEAQAALAEALRPEGEDVVRADVDAAMERLRRLLHEDEDGDGAADLPDTPLRLALQNLVVRRARFMACGVLSTRQADYLARENINDIVLDLIDGGEVSTDAMGDREAPFRMRLPQFRFGYLQMTAGFVAVLLAVLFCGVAREVVLPSLTGRAIGEQVWSWLLFSPFVALAFALPLIPAAALRYFLNDMKERQMRRLTFEHHLLAGVVTALAGLLLATIVLLALGVLILNERIEDFDLLVLIPWALPMTGSAVMFMLLSQVNLTASVRLNRLIDAVAFGVVGAVLSLVAHAGSLMVRDEVSTAAELSQHLGDARALTLAAVLAVTSAVLGLTQCQSSRRGLLERDDRRLSSDQVWTAMRRAPGRLLSGAGMAGPRG